MTPDKSLLATILINNFNYGRFLREAIDSALSQTHRMTEVVVVDDGSTDNSREIILSYHDRIIPIFKANGGQASAFNAGVLASKGAWILFLDADDMFYPSKAEQVLRVALEYPRAGAIAHNLAYCTTDGRRTDFIPFNIGEACIIDERRRIVKGKERALPATSGLSLRRDVFERIFPIPEALRINADQFLRPVVLSRTPVVLLPEPLALQRLHGDNLYTLANEDPSEVARLHCAQVRALVFFHLGRAHPALARLVWKAYAWNLYQVWSCQSVRSSALLHDLRKRYNVMNGTAVCLCYVVATFGWVWAKDILAQLRRRASFRSAELLRPPPSGNVSAGATGTIRTRAAARSLGERHD